MFCREFLCPKTQTHCQVCASKSCMLALICDFKNALNTSRLPLFYIYLNSRNGKTQYRLPTWHKIDVITNRPVTWGASFEISLCPLQFQFWLLCHSSYLTGNDQLIGEQEAEEIVIILVPEIILYKDDLPWAAYTYTATEW